MKKDEIVKYASDIHKNHHNKKEILRPSPATRQYLDVVVDTLYHKGVYTDTIEILKILLVWDQNAGYYEQLAECYAKEGNYVEAGICTAKACDLAPYHYASISNQSYYDLVNKLYSDLGVDFKIL